MNKSFYLFIFFFKMAIKIAGSALKSRVGRVSGNKGICFLGLICKRSRPYRQMNNRYSNIYVRYNTERDPLKKK